MREVPLESPIEEKIAWAEACCRRFGDQLLRDEGVYPLLNELWAAIEASRNKMSETGIVETCKDCEEREGGSCCGAGLENKYSGTLLLINLFLGVSLPERAYDGSSCFFLTQNGCALMARHVICVNYLCKKAGERVHPRDIAALREFEGVELQLLFHLNERIKRVLAPLVTP
ncbi:MAG: hypothetical protein MUO52_04685 [Desulfobacterales bacterium]|nr:hypothetical protein [Desulfobacterales bacterium]